MPRGLLGVWSYADSVSWLRACCFCVYYNFYELEGVVQYLQSWQELRGQLQMGHFLFFLLRISGKQSQTLGLP